MSRNNILRAKTKARKTGIIFFINSGKTLTYEGKKAYTFLVILQNDYI